MSDVFMPNEYQLDVFDFIKNETGHCVVEAVAGSGKTVTIVKALNLVPVGSRCAFVAFNKHIAEELQKKAPAKVQVMTLHSMGFRAIRDSSGKVTLDDSKIYKIVRGLTEDFDDWKLRSSVVSNVQKIIGLLKGNLLLPTPENIDNIMSHHGIDMPDYSKFYTIVEKTFQISLSQSSTIIDFDDMVFLPGWTDMECQKYDYLFVDEAQDLNPAQLSLVLSSIKDGGRIIAVGDRNQSIYGFRGADVQSIPKIIAHLKATVLPLSITYRCPRCHVEMAQEIVPEIKAAPDAIEGKIIEGNYDNFYDAVQENDLVLCRNNSPLLSPCMNLIQQGRKATIRGRDIGKNLISLIKELKAKDLDTLYRAVEMWEGTEFAKAVKRGQNPEAIEDKANCIKILIDCAKVNSVEELITHIENLFSDSRAEIAFSSIHKAKGLEANNVFILEPSLMPSPYAEQEWELIQEENVRYVAITRAKQNLYFINK